jgi:hypothetical protein
MSRAVRYPDADTSTQWRGQGGATMPDVDKLLLHTTESTGWPAYPDFQPTLTFNPWKPRGQRWRQHLPINGAASTLQNAGDFRTNRANVCQVEIVAYCDPARSASSAYIDRITDDAYLDLAELLVWLNAEWSVPIKASRSTYPRYPGSYGPNNGVRMTVQQFGTFAGVVTHMEAPGNQHGDPGDLNIAHIIRLARQLANPEEPSMPTARPDYEHGRDPLDQDRVPTKRLTAAEWEAVGDYATAGGHLRHIEEQNDEIIRLLRGK